MRKAKPNETPADIQEKEHASTGTETKDLDTAAAKEMLKARLNEIKARAKESNEAIRQGKGRLELETPIKAGGEEITELAYDFTELTGMEYVDAMDSDMNSQNIYKITYRQALSLFAKAAEKHTEHVDKRDIIEQIGMTDAVEAVQLASNFFGASQRAARLRISKL